MPAGGCSVGLPKILPILVVMATWSFFPLPISQCSLPAIAHVSPPHWCGGGDVALARGKLRHGLGHDSVPPHSGAGTHYVLCPRSRMGKGGFRALGTPTFPLVVQGSPLF